MNVIDHIKTYPFGGGYTWDASKPTSGTPKAIIYKGEVILQKDSATYCCGLTFCVWFELFGQHIDIAVSEMKKVQRLWYCATGLHGGCEDALSAINQRVLGIMLEDAQPGDFLQLWRVTGSGHSVAYISHTKTDLTYWSTQPKTNGIGYRTEPLANIKELYFARPKTV